MKQSIYFTFFELMVIILFGFNLRHALKAGPANVFQLVAGVLFGIFLELATIQQLHAYSYGKFLFMIGNVPLAIGIAWGIILYTARLISDKSGLPLMVRPLLDGLLALNIDLAMDAIAIRLGMWNWGKDYNYEYFGVPFANFWAWFWVVFSFSFGIRLLTYLLNKTSKKNPHRSTIITNFFIALGALLIGLVGLLSTNAFIAYIIPVGLRTLVIASTLITVFILIICFRPKLSLDYNDNIAFWIPFSFHCYFLGIGIISGTIFNPLFLLIMSLVMFLLLFYLHRQNIRQLITRKS